jgi:hypothetical protein
LAFFNYENNGAPEEIRTPNLLIRSQVLYPIELRARACSLRTGGPYIIETDQSKPNLPLFSTKVFVSVFKGFRGFRLT